MFRGWCLSINELRGHRLQFATQQRRAQAKPKEGDFFSFFPLRGMQGHFTLWFICNSVFCFIKPGDYWEEKVCSKWLGKGSRLLTPPGSHLPSGLLILMTSLYHHSVSQLCQQLPQQPSDAFCVRLCRQESGSSQKAHIEYILPTVRNLRVWLSLDPASWLGLLSHRNTQIPPTTYLNGKRKFSKDTIRVPC